MIIHEMLFVYSHLCDLSPQGILYPPEANFSKELNQGCKVAIITFKISKLVIKRRIYQTT